MTGQNESVPITWHAGGVSREDRAAVLKQKGSTLWFTGLSGSGKSTLAVAIEQALLQLGHAAYVLDGDNLRFGLNASPKILADTHGLSESAAQRFGLGFAAADRAENIRRVGEVAKILSDAGLITLASFVSPYRKDRDAVRAAHQSHKSGPIPFFEIHVSTSLAVCESRDPKGLYKQARATLAAGKDAGFTGIDDPYEPPANPEFSVDTAAQPTAQSVALLIAFLRERGILASE